MRKKEEVKKSLEEAFCMWISKGKNGEYLSGKTTSECGDTEIIGFFNKDKKNYKQPDITICKRVDDKKLEEICVLWKSVSKDKTKPYLFGHTSENENIVAFYNDGKNPKAPYIKGYFKDEE